MDSVESTRKLLSGGFIYLDKLHDYYGIFDRVDAFVKLSRDNETIQHVVLRLFADPDAHRYTIWDKIAEGIGNFQALRTISI